MTEPAGLAEPAIDLTPTVHLRADPHLDRRVTSLVRSVGRDTSAPIMSAEQSVEASATLAKVQQLRRFIAGVYADAKRPLADAKKRLDAQQAALLTPLRDAETALTAAILNFEAARPPRAIPEPTASGALPAPAPPAAPTLVAGMGTRTHYRAEVTDLRALVLAVAAQIMDADPDSAMTQVTRRWLRSWATPQATLDLLRPDPGPLNALARALKEDLVLPGVVATASTTLVDRG